MAQIDSGLGWSCDEDYYFPDAGKIVELSSGGTITKSVGGAICGIIRDSNNGYYSCYVLSTEQNNVEVSVADGMVIAADKVSKTTAYGVWYLSLCYKDQSSSWESQSVPFVGSFASPTAEYAMEKILEAANLTFDKKVTTDSYVKSYVEGIVKGNNERLKVGDVSTLKTTTKTDIVSAINELKGTIYTFHVDPDEADSYEAVTYHDDAVGMTPAYMDSTAFNYGSWENAFFMPKPCMLNYDGTVAYYLDPNDYSKKADGAASDISDLSFPGNAMMEFPLIWWKSWGDGWVSIADYQVDATYKCWSNRDADGNIIPYFYLPIYNGCIYDGKMRSISGIQLKSWSTTAYSSNATYAVGDEVNHNNRMWKCITAVETPEDFDISKWEQFAFNANTTGEEEITYATANNVTSKIEWYIDQWCDRVLIQGLLVLMSKSIDTQAKFGRGIDSGSQAAKEAYVTGSLNNKGLFYGSTSNGSTAVKVFGMENYWALQWRRVAGLIGSTNSGNNTYLYKMTASTADGTTVKGYNTTGSGYITASGRPSEHNWLKKMQFGQFGTLPLEVGSYSTQYYKDHYWTGTGYALFGGYSDSGSSCGAFYLRLSLGVGYRNWDVGAAPSCKPCLIKEVIINE